MAIKTRIVLRDLERVARRAFTGHKTRSVFERYDIVNEADLRAAMGKLAGVHEPTGKEKGKSRRSGRVATFHRPVKSA